jgi:hypothetical protein
LNYKSKLIEEVIVLDREFICCKCGLMFWDEMNKETLGYNYKCPDCDNTELVFAMDTMGWVYFYQNHKNNLPKMWSSEKYAPKFAINHYSKQGVEIR